VAFQLPIASDWKGRPCLEFRPAPSAMSAVVVHLEPGIGVQSDAANREFPLGGQPVPVTPGELAIDDTQIDAVPIREQQVTEDTNQRNPGGSLQHAALLSGAARVRRKVAVANSRHEKT